MQGETDPEILHELGNMFLVRVNGQTKQVANTTHNNLLYKHGLYSLLHGDGDAGRTVLSDADDDVYAAVEPTPNDRVYAIWYGDLNTTPVLSPPSKAEDVLRGVRDALNDPANYGTLADVVEWIEEHQVRRDLMEKLLPQFPAASVIPNDEGWVVEGLFLVTWDARVFVISTDLTEGSYKVRGGISKTDDACEFITLNLPYDPTEEVENDSLTVNGDEVELDETELMFLSKVQWLLHYDKNYDDPGFWAPIKRHVMRGGR